MQLHFIKSKLNNEDIIWFVQYSLFYAAIAVFLKIRQFLVHAISINYSSSNYFNLCQISLHRWIFPPGIKSCTSDPSFSTPNQYSLHYCSVQNFLQHKCVIDHSSHIVISFFFLEHASYSYMLPATKKCQKNIFSMKSF